MFRIHRMAGLLAVAALLGLTAPAALADDAALRARLIELEKKQAAMQQEMDELKALLEARPPAETKAVEVERKQNVIVEEVRKIREAISLPETKELKSEYGLGPAASKVYGVTHGVSLGGYGEFNYRNVVDDNNGESDEFDILRLVLYTGYKFSDHILFNSEIEFEHGLTGDDADGEVKVEFANIDVLLNPKINLRGGLILVPMGFLNEIHEPPFFHGTVRPVVETQIIPSTWSTGGVGIFGELAPGLTYRTYGVVGLDATGFESSGIREGRQEAVEQADSFAWVGRMDYVPIEMLSVGASAYLGNSGQGHSYGDDEDDLHKVDVFTQIYEAHAQLRTHGFEARALGAYVGIDDAGIISANNGEPIASSQWGAYGEIAYDVLPLVLPDTGHYLAPWFRYSHVDTQADVPAGFLEDELFDYDVFEVGITYKPLSQVVFKLDYRDQDAKGGDLPDEVRIGAGFAY